MKIKIITVGNLKDKFNLLAEEEYVKRIKRFCPLQLVEIKEENFVKTPSEADKMEIMRREGQNIIKEIEGAFVVMDIGGEMLSSVGFSKKIDELFLSSSTITFAIGGSYGLHPDVKAKARYKMSFSKMTFPHGLFKVMLEEQIYRGLAIKNNLPYHK